MKNSEKLSNNFLVYGTIILSVLIYIFGITSVMYIIKEASQTSFSEVFFQQPAFTIIGISCLLLIGPSYKFTKRLKLLDITEHKKGPAILTLYSPFFISDMPQADTKTTIQNINEIKANKYFRSLVEIQFTQNGNSKVVKSFMSPKSLSKIETV